MSAYDDTVKLKVGGQILAGWQRVSVTRSMDNIPASFELEVTERYPDTADIDVRPGQPCTVSIGADLVITGYVDHYLTMVNAQNHTIRVSGRSKSADLVDCSALTAVPLNDQQQPPAGALQVLSSTALGIAQQLAAVYGVTVESDAGDGAEIPQFNINIGETVWEVFDRLLRGSAFVAYDMPDGSVRFAQAGKDSMASGFTVGVNCEQAEIAYTMDQRFQVYEGTIATVIDFGKEHGGVSYYRQGNAVRDEGVPRFRHRFVVSEQVDNEGLLAERRARWEMNRRAGRSQVFNVVCDAWRDSAGALWAPNHLAPIRAKQVKLADATWCIGGVTYTRDEHGQHAQVQLMPTSAFTPEPISLLPTPPTTQDIAGNNPTSPNPGGGRELGAAP